MNAFLKHIVFLLICFLLSTSICAQVKIADLEQNLQQIDSNAIFELESNTKGFLPPRVELQSISSVHPLSGTVVNGMTVYNISSSVGEGYYYWENNQWNKLNTVKDLDSLLNKFETSIGLLEDKLREQEEKILAQQESFKLQLENTGFKAGAIKYQIAFYSQFDESLQTYTEGFWSDSLQNLWENTVFSSNHDYHARLSGFINFENTGVFTFKVLSYGDFYIKIDGVKFFEESALTSYTNKSRSYRVGAGSHKIEIYFKQGANKTVFSWGENPDGLVGTILGSHFYFDKTRFQTDNNSEAVKDLPALEEQVNSNKVISSIDKSNYLSGLKYRVYRSSTTNKWEIPSEDKFYGEALTEGVWKNKIDNECLNSIVNNVIDSFYHVRFSGIIYAEDESLIRMLVGSDDGAKVLIDGEVVANNWFGQVYTERNFSFNLSEGAHTIEIWYFNYSGEKGLNLKWGFNFLFPSNTWLKGSQFYYDVKLEEKKTSDLKEKALNTETKNDLAALKQNSPFKKYKYSFSTEMAPATLSGYLNPSSADLHLGSQGSYIIKVQQERDPKTTGEATRVSICTFILTAGVEKGVVIRYKVSNVANGSVRVTNNDAAYTRLHVTASGPMKSNVIIDLSNYNGSVRVSTYNLDNYYWNWDNVVITALRIKP